MEPLYLDLLGSCAALAHVAAVHAHIARAHPTAFLFLRNSLLAAYCRLGAGAPLHAARLLHNAISYNLLIAAYASRAAPWRRSRARGPPRGFRVHWFKYAAALDVRNGKAVHAMAGVGNGVFLSNSLATNYVRRVRRPGLFDEAEERHGTRCCLGSRR